MNRFQDELLLRFRWRLVEMIAWCEYRERLYATPFLRTLEAKGFLQ